MTLKTPRTDWNNISSQQMSKEEINQIVPRFRRMVGFDFERAAVAIFHCLDFVLGGLVDLFFRIILALTLRIINIVLPPEEAEQKLRRQQELRVQVYNHRLVQQELELLELRRRVDFLNVMQQCRAGESQERSNQAGPSCGIQQAQEHWDQVCARLPRPEDDDFLLNLGDNEELEQEEEQLVKQLTKQDQHEHQEQKEEEHQNETEHCEMDQENQPEQQELSAEGGETKKSSEAEGSSGTEAT